MHDKLKAQIEKANSLKDEDAKPKISLEDSLAAEI